MNIYKIINTIFFMVLFIFIGIGIGTINYNRIQKSEIQKNKIMVQKEKQKQKIKEDIINSKIIIMSQFIYENNCRVDLVSSLNYATFICAKTKHPSLVIAIITSETNFRPTLRSSIGALGLGQIRPEMWLKELNTVFPGLFDENKDLYNWKKNIIAVDYIVDKLLIKFNGDIDKVLKYYVGGLKKKYIQTVKDNVNYLNG